MSSISPSSSPNAFTATLAKTQLDTAKEKLLADARSGTATTTQLAKDTADVYGAQGQLDAATGTTTSAAQEQKALDQFLTDPNQGVPAPIAAQIKQFAQTALTGAGETLDSTNSATLGRQLRDISSDPLKLAEHKKHATSQNILDRLGAPGEEG